MNTYTLPQATVSHWTPLVAGVAAGDSAAIEQFYRVFGWLEPSFSRQVGPEHAVDCYHDVILTAVTQIQKGLLREPERVAGYVKTIAVARVALEMKRLVARRNTLNADDAMPIETAADPEARLREMEHREIARRLLATLPAKHREVLVRF